MNQDNGVKSLPTASYAEQYRRQRISDDWEPKGFERYKYQRALLHEMPVLGGASDGLLAAPERYREATSCQDTLDCHCGRD
jgi:hypothetical protein